MRAAASILLLGAICAVAADAAPAQGRPQGSPAPSSARSGITWRFLARNQLAPAPYELVNGFLTFRARVAGRDVWALLDNRAERSIIDTALARTAGLTIEAPRGRIRTPTGAFPRQLVADVPVVIPGQLAVKMPLAAINLETISRRLGRRIGAVLGAELLGQIALLLDSGRRTFQLGPSGSMELPPGFPPVALQSARPQVEVIIGDRPVLLTLDLGSNATISLTPESWARVGSRDARFTSRPTFHAEGQASMTGFARVPHARLGPISRYDVEVSVRPWPKEDGDGIVGLGFLSNTDFALDTKARKLWIVPPPRSAPTQ